MLTLAFSSSYNLYVINNGVTNMQKKPIYKQQNQYQIVWEKFKPNLKLKKFWLSVLGVLSVLGISFNTTMQEKIADIAIQIAEVLTSEMAQLDTPETLSE